MWNTQHTHYMHTQSYVHTYLHHTHKHTQTHTYTDTHLCLEEEWKQARNDKDIIKTHTYTNPNKNSFTFRVKNQGNNKSRGKVNVIKRNK